MNINLFSKYFVLIVIAILLGVSSLIFRLSKAEYFQFPGKVTFNLVEVGTYSNGTVKGVEVEEGQIIENGAVILEIENEIMSEKLSKMDKNSPNFSEPDFVELQKKIDNFRIKAPSQSIVTKINKYTGSFVKENETIATLVPLETIKYTFEVNEKNLTFRDKDALANFMKPGQKVIVRFSETYEVDAEIKSIVPDLENTDVKIVYLATTQQNLALNTSQSFVVKILKNENKNYLNSFLEIF